MRKVKRSGLFAGFAAVALAVLGLGIYGLAADTPSPLKNAVLSVTAPVKKLFTDAGNRIDDLLDYCRGVDELKAENEALKKQLVEAENRLRTARALESENESLRTLLNVAQRYSEYDLVMAEIIGTETGSWGYSFLLNVGTESGIQPDQCVISDEGMVGWIREAGKGWSVLSPLTDTALRSGGIVSRTRETGVLQGDYTLSADGLLELAYLPAESPRVVVGDTVETAGTDGLWPAGLAVGRVRELRAAEDGAGFTAVLAPVCDLTALHRVYIVRSFMVTD